jgi:hypothetical protein
MKAHVCKVHFMLSSNGALAHAGDTLGVVVGQVATGLTFPAGSGRVGRIFGDGIAANQFPAGGGITSGPRSAYAAGKTRRRSTGMSEMASTASQARDYSLTSGFH